AQRLQPECALLRGIVFPSRAKPLDEDVLLAVAEITRRGVRADGQRTTQVRVVDAEALVERRGAQPLEPEGASRLHRPLAKGRDVVRDHDDLLRAACPA